MDGCERESESRGLFRRAQPDPLPGASLAASIDRTWAWRSEERTRRLPKGGMEATGRESKSVLAGAEGAEGLLKVGGDSAPVLGHFVVALQLGGGGFALHVLDLACVGGDIDHFHRR